MKQTIIAISALFLGACAFTAGDALASGQKAGGYGRARISETGGKPVPARRVKRVRSGQAAGGPGGDRVSTTGGRLSVQGTVADPNRTVPVGTSRSGQRAGGSYRQ